MDFNLNSYLKQLDSIFEKTKKKIESRIKKPQAAEDHFGFKKTKVRSLRYELSRMEQDMRKMTEREFKKLKEEVDKEDVEQVDEISKDMMGRYLKKSASSLRNTSYKHGAKSMSKNNYDDKKDFRKIANRQSGIQRVASRLSKREEVKVDEDSVKKARVNLRIKQTQARQQKVLDRLKRRKSRITTEKIMKNGDKLSGKKEPINLEPELKTDKR